LDFEVELPNVMLGVNATTVNQFTVQRKSLLTPNIGLEMEMSDAISDVLLDDPNPLRRDLLE
jgi:hypothetical protein